MKKVFSFAAAALCVACISFGMQAGSSALSSQAASAPSKVNTLEVGAVADPGFVGHPLLKKYGYGANVGAFRLEIGQGVSNPEFLVDNDPANYATAAGIGATVAIDHILVISPDSETGIEAPKYHSGDVVGFVLSDGSNAGSVLNLDLIKMFVIYLYNGKDLVHTINAQGTELDILGLSLISYGEDNQTIKLPVPKDKDGNDIEFDGLGLGVAGVDASVIEQVRIHYAFVDNLVEAPIIKRYFPNATGKVEGLAAGANNLVNNNLSDGAGFGVINIGGGYFTVLAGEPLPTGVEAGFKLTIVNVADVSLGSATILKAIVKDASGNYKEIELSKGFDVIGLKVAGGGETEITAMIPPVLEDGNGNQYTEFYGLRLESVKGVELLGTTTVHYAFVKLPKLPEDRVPYLASLYVLPGASYEHAGIYNADKVNYDARQTFNNSILIRNSASHPLLTEDKMPEAYRNGEVASPSGSQHNYAMMSLFRNKKYEKKDATPEYIGAICIWKESDTEWYYTFQKDGQLASTANKNKKPIPGPDANGVIDFGDIALDNLESFDDFYRIGNDPSSQIVAIEYWLYVHDNQSTEYKNMNEGFELDYADVNVPQIAPVYEIAGLHSIDNLKNLDIASAPHPSITAGEYKNYIEVVVPDLLDSETAPNKVTVYRHDTYASHQDEQKYAEIELTGVNEWTANGQGLANINYIHKNGQTKLIIGVEPLSMTSSENYYTAVIGVKLSDPYIKELKQAFPHRDNFTVSAEYGWIPSEAPVREVPTLDYKDIVTFFDTPNNQNFLKSFVSTDLKDATAGHAGAGAIYYSQWCKVTSTAAKVARPKAVVAADGEQVQHTAFNENQKGIELSYDNAEKTSHTAVLYANHSSNGSVNYNVATRAYVPVLPSGFTAEQMEPSYIVAHKDADGNIDEPIVTGIESVGSDSSAEEVQYFNLQGVSVAFPAEPGIYIELRGGKARKVAIN